MATTTPNYGWDVPTSTDYVKDGASAIETLGDDIDASMFTALNGKKAGMQLITTQSFSAAATTTISNCFSSAYDDYHINIETTAQSTNSSVVLQFQAGASPTASNYAYAVVDNTGAALTPAFASPANFARVSYANTASFKGMSIVADIFSPNAARQTSYISQSFSGWNTVGVFTSNASGRQTDTTQFTSLVLTSDNSANLTGRISVYGYAK
jgi:hypothetical protein